MADLVQDIGTYLIGLGRASAIGEDLVLDFLPNDPDSIICITEYGGSGVPIGVSALTRRVQILVRDVAASVAKQRAWEIFNDLDHPPGDYPEGRILYLTPVRWTVAQALQQPTPLGQDANSRYRYAFNVSFTTYRD